MSAAEGFKLFLKSIPSTVPKNDVNERVHAMRKATALYNLHWRDIRKGWEQFESRMEEAFGQDWRGEFTKLTLEPAPTRHTYANKMEDED